MTDPGLSLAAGTLPALSPVEAIRCAAAAGFDWTGLRPDPLRLPDYDVAEIRQVARDQGVRILDVEVVRLGTTADEVVDRLVDFACEVGAAHLLVVSGDEDRDRAIEGLRRICTLVEGSGVRPVIEFMGFTAVRDLGAASSMVAALDHGAAGILVDALHLARSGGTAAQVAALDGALLPYVQLCDGPTLGPRDPAGLADEARHHRLLPGSGQLPLAELLDAHPWAMVSVEVQSEAGWTTRTPLEWAKEVRRAAQDVLAGSDADRRSSSAARQPQQKSG